MSDQLIELANVTTPRLIKIIGVGGGGGNAVGQMYRDNIPEVRYLVANTDRKALEDSPVPDHLQLGPGLGAGGNPEIGLKYAEENIDAIRKTLDDDTKMVFITAGMGGGTGTGASPVIAREARNKGILTIGIVTIPFLFERERQIDKALDGLETLAREVDAMLVINNQRLCEIYPNLAIIEAFKKADRTLSMAVSSITEVISVHGRISLDFQDVRTVLKDGGVAVMSTGFGEGEGRVTHALTEAIHSPLLNNNDIYNAKHILIAITTNDDPASTLQTYEMDEITAFMNKFDSNINSKWGLALDRSLGNKIKITILASGFGLQPHKKKRYQELYRPTPPVVDPGKELRRDNFYGNFKGRPRRRNNIYYFSEDDLSDSKVQKMVDEIPTRKRTGEFLESIKFISTKNNK